MKSVPKLSARLTTKGRDTTGIEKGEEWTTLEAPRHWGPALGR